MATEKGTRGTKKIFKLILAPETYDWKNSDWIETKKLAEKINAAVAKCNGKKGCPTLQQAIEFYDKVIDLGGGKFFAWEFCAMKDGPGVYFKRNLPKDMGRKDWMSQINDTLKKFYSDELSRQRLAINRPKRLPRGTATRPAKSNMK